MKNHHINIAGAFLAGLSLLLASSCIHEGDLALAGIPDIGFTYASDGLTLTFTSGTPEATDISWKASDGSTGSGNEFVHKFAKPATYWVQMTGTFNGREQTCATKVLVAKPANVSMTDDTFDDWDKVTDPDFIFTGETPGTSPIIAAKFDYDANYIYFYVEFSNKANPGVDSEKAIFSFNCDSDDNLATGMSVDGVGADYLMEGCLTCSSPWYDFYNCTDQANWTHIVDENFLNSIMILGHKEVTDDVTRIEWAYSRSQFEITSTSMKFVLKMYDGDWSDADAVYDSDGNKAISISLNKEK